MTYNISRYEQNRSHDGNITSIFLAVSINNETDGSYFEYWLDSEEMALVLLDEANLKPILTKCFAEAELKLDNELATRPMESIKPLAEEGKKEELEMLVKASDIALKKSAITAEKLKLEEPVIK